MRLSNNFGDLQIISLIKNFTIEPNNYKLRLMHKCFVFKKKDSILSLKFRILNIVVPYPLFVAMKNLYQTYIIFNIIYLYLFLNSTFLSPLIGPLLSLPRSSWVYNMVQRL